MFHLHPSQIFLICGTFLNIFVLSYFVIDNNYKLLITIKRVDAYLMNQSELMN